MNVKIQSRGIAGGHNSGSCGGYAAYLEHENIEKAEAGMQDQQIPCALPETDEFTKALADQVYKIIAPVIRSEIKSAVGATDLTLKHEHTHRHYSYSASFDMINDTAKKWIIGLSISVVVLFGIIAYGIHYMRTSELFLGKRCMDIYISDYVTEKENGNPVLEKVSLKRTRRWGFDFCMFENRQCEINSYKIKTISNQSL